MKKSGDVRKGTLNFMEQKNDFFMKSEDDLMPKVLLVDEIDFMLNKQLYGKLYRPCARLQN